MVVRFAAGILSIVLYLIFWYYCCKCCVGTCKAIGIAALSAIVTVLVQSLMQNAVLQTLLNNSTYLL